MYLKHYTTQPYY